MTDSGLAIMLNVLPSLVSIPSLASTNVSSLHFASLTSLTTMPILPTSPTLQAVTLDTLTALQNFPDFSAYRLTALNVAACYSLPPNTMPTFQPDRLIQLQLTDMQLTIIPSWLCNPSAQNILLNFMNNSLTALSDCLGSMSLRGLILSNAGSQLPWIPVELFQQQESLNTLWLDNLPSLIVNQTLLDTIWNLPSLHNLQLPPHYAANGISPVASYFPSTASLLTISGSPINMPIPDDYFIPFVNF